MDEAASDGKMQYRVMSRESIEVLLEILDAIDQLDDDELSDLVKTLSPDLREELVSP